MILNKKKNNASVRVRTIEAEAKAGHDFDEFDNIITFKGEQKKFIDIKIIDDDNWEPDKEFFI